MKTSYAEKAMLFIAFMILILFAVCASPYCNSNIENNNFRVKRSEEYQYQTNSNVGSFDSLSSDNSLIQKSEYIQSALEDVLQIFLENKLIIFFMLAVILTFHQFFWMIKRRNILISQTKNKIFMVHYLQLKDGKKGALSFLRPL